MFIKSLRRYYFVIIIVVFCALLFLSYNSHETTKEIISSKYDAQSVLVENSVVNALKSANGAYSISEKILNDEMRYYSKILLDEYEDNPEIRTWNLKKLQSKMGNYEIYIINNNLKVISTTFEPDMGLDFSKFNSFAGLLNDRLEGTEFVSDKMDISTNTGELKKYSYVPTPDHKYLIELSINIAERYSIFKELNVFALARDLVKEYPSVKDISFYKFNREASAVALIKDEKNPMNTNISRDNKMLVQEAVLSNAIKSKTVDNSGFVTTYKFIPILAKNNEDLIDWWNSFAIGITYNNQEMLKEIRSETNSFLITTFIIALVFLTFIAIMVYLLKKTEYLAYHDHLTGLANRKAFEDYFNKVRKKSDSRIAILYLDLDKFKPVNDNYGHEFGDKLLNQLGKRLKNILGQGDNVSRVGGDEFVILLSGIKSEKEAFLFMEQLEVEIKKPFVIDGISAEINCSIGASFFPEEGFTVEDLINKADISMYRVKEKKALDSK